MQVARVFSCQERSMSYTKYVMTQGGKFAMVTKYAGMEHAELARVLDDLPTSAGFVTAFEYSLAPYGRSITLSMGTNEADEQIINDALRSGQIHCFYDNNRDQWVATNCTHILTDSDSETIDSLKIKRVIE